MDIVKVLSQLTASAGVSGQEMSACKAAAALLGNYGETSVDYFGNVYCKVGTHEPCKRTLLIDAHIDEIGMIVTYITNEGFLKVSNCGGLDRRVLQAQQAAVYGKRKITGFVTSTPPHLGKDDTAVPEINDIFIDIGYNKEQAEKLVSPGDMVLIENELAELQNGRVTSKALDNRSGAAAVILAIDMIKYEKTAYNIYVLLSSQEETGERGAITGAYKINADMAVVVDVSFAKSHGGGGEECGELGKGPMIGIAPSLSRKMSNKFIELAKEKSIPFQIEVMNGKTGTNADAVGVTREGISTVTVSIPEKYMHTPVETVDLKDIENTARLIAEFLKSEEEAL